jgi:hypothetical protein
VKRVPFAGVLVLALVLGVSVVASAMPASPVTRQDAASTKAFIGLQELSDNSAIRSASSVNAAENAVVGQGRSGCPNVLKDAPKKPDRHQLQPITQFFTEALLVLDVEQLAPVRGISDRIGREQQRLRFSDPALQWQVDVGGSALLAFVQLRPPDFCTDARMLAATHFTKLTAAGRRFVKEASTLFAQAAADPTDLVRLMRPYAPEAVSVALNRLEALQHTVDHKLAFDRHLRALLRAVGETHLAGLFP